jgi:hypothetical protein
VLRVDAWNPPARAVIDGDAFAFRRFVDWLADAAIAAGLDEPIVFCEEEEEEEEKEEEGNDADEAAEAAEEKTSTVTSLEQAGWNVTVRRASPRKGKEKRIALSTWLAFDLPRLGDRFRFDWRYQWDIVNAASTIGDAFGGIYGMSPEKLETLKMRDAPTWRRFLCKVVDPRFAYPPPTAVDDAR